MLRGGLACLDAALSARANQVARSGASRRATVALMAERLAGVEVALMVWLLLTGHRAWVARMLLAVGLVYLSTEALGRLVPRRRPFQRLSHVEPLVGHTYGRSFPSRHVASGLAMAVVARQADPALGKVMAVVAAGLGTMRVAAGLHYPSDVVAGGALGVSIGLLSAANWRDPRHRGSTVRL